MTRAAALLCLLVLSAHADAAPPAVEASRVLAHIKYLADDARAGRDTGSPGARASEAYIVARLRRWGLQPAGSNGFAQPFTVAPGVVGHNVIAWLPGSAAGGEHVVVGAHYDHVGRGAFGSRGGAGGKGKIHNGADDNASGSAVLLELARALSQAEVKPRRSVLFIWFSGEERGLLGSQHYCAQPTKPLADAVAMINLDMVGRGRTGVFSVTGGGTARGLKAFVEQTNRPHANTLERMPIGVAPSDNTSFYLKRIPVLFLSSGTHAQYHKPDDDWPLINAEGAARIGRLAHDLARGLADRPARFKHRWAELHPPSLMRALLSGARMLREQQRLEAGRGKLGVRGATRRGETGGARLTSVAPGSAAARAGLKAGDRITAVNGTPVATFSALARALDGSRPGQSVTLERERKGERTTVTAVLD